MKRTMTFLIIIAILMSLCACGRDVGSAMYDEKQRAESIPTETAPATTTPTEAPTQSVPTETPTPDPTADPATTIVLTEQYDLAAGNRYSLKSYQFNNGISWVSMINSDTNTWATGLINEAGEVIYFVDQDRFALTDSAIAGIITTPFINGLSCIYPYDSADAAYSLPGFIIVNQKGEEVYSCFDSNMYMCGQGDDGNYIILKHESGFAGDDWIFCTLNSSLKLTETGIKGSNDGHDRGQNNPGLKTIAEGIYITNYNLLCIESGCRFRLNYNGALLTYVGHSDNYACFYYSNYNYLVPYDVLRTATSDRELLDIMQTNTECKKFDAANEYIFNNYGFESWNHGSYLYAFGTRQYLNYDTGDSITYPTFPDGVKYFRVDNFKGGYAALYLLGVDEKGYVTVIDESGEQLYDPVACKGFGIYNAGDMLEATSYNGYIFCSWVDTSDNKSYMQIFDRSGQSKKIGDNLEELSGKYCYSDFSFALNIGEDYIWVSGSAFGKNAFVSLDGKTTIESVTASYNAAGDLLFSQ